MGVDDYGIYNVVGGIIVFFTILNNGLASASSRYITAEVGAGTKESGIKVFNVCLQAHAVIAIIILLLAESIGLWIVNMVLNFPESRMFAANVVYQISIITALIVYVMQKIIRLNIPVLSQYISDIVEIVERTK